MTTYEERPVYRCPECGRVATTRVATPYCRHKDDPNGFGPLISTSKTRWGYTRMERVYLAPVVVDAVLKALEPYGAVAAA